MRAEVIKMFFFFLLFFIFFCFFFDDVSHLYLLWFYF